MITERWFKAGKNATWLGFCRVFLDGANGTCRYHHLPLLKSPTTDAEALNHITARRPLSQYQLDSLIDTHEWVEVPGPRIHDAFSMEDAEL